MPNDFYQIQLENKSHPDYLKWEKLNFALRRIFSKLNELTEATTATTPEAKPEAKPEAGAGATALVDTVVPIAPAFDVVQSAPYTAMLGMENPLAPDNALAPGWKNVIQLGVEIADDAGFTNIIKTLVIGGTGLQRQIFYWVSNAAGTWYARAFAVNLIGRSLPSSTVMFYLDNSQGDTDVPSAPTVTVYNTDDLDTVQFREVTARINFTGCTNIRSLWQATVQFHTSAAMTNPEASPIYNPGANKITIRQGSDRFIDPTATFVSSGVLPGHYVMWTLESSWPGSPATKVNIAMISEVVSNTELKFVSPYLGPSGDYPYRITKNYEQVDSGAGFYPYTHIESKAARDKGYVDIKIALPAGVNYYARAWIFNSIGRSSASAVTPAFQTVDLPAEGSDDTGVPNAPVAGVICNKLSEKLYQFTFAAEKPTVNGDSINYGQFQVALSTDPTFASPVYEEFVPGAPGHILFVTGVVATYLFRVRFNNSFGLGAWCDVITKDNADTTAYVDTDVPGVPQNITVKTSAIDSNIPGINLEVTWTKPLTNFQSLAWYEVQVYTSPTFPTDTYTFSGTAAFVLGSYTITDNSATFDASVVGKDLFFYSSGNLRGMAKIISWTTHTLTLETYAPFTGNYTYKVVTNPAWLQVTKVVDIQTELYPGVPKCDVYKTVITGLALGVDYYVRVNGMNTFGVGPWGTPGGYGGGTAAVVAGIRTADLQNVALKQVGDNTTPTGTTISSKDYYVLTGTPDALSSQVILYWYYTQGAYTCNQFTFTISDGTATYVYRAKGPTASGTYSLTINRFKKSKTLSVTISIEFAGVNGQVVAGTDSWSFSAGSNYGTTHTATSVGEIDWAGGQVWFETDQYRNNTPPTNGISSITPTAVIPSDGANQKTITLSNISYTQGAYPATHLAILVKNGGGTITLTNDAIVTLLNLSSLPSSYVIPYSFKATDEHTVALAAVALTKDGYSFNSTFAQSTTGYDANIEIYGKNINLSPGGSRKIYAFAELAMGTNNITINSGYTVDGVDVSAHDAATSDIHGTTGAVLGANMINTPGSSFKLLMGTNGKLCCRQVEASAWPSSSDLNDPEMVVWYNSNAGGTPPSGVRLYFRIGSTYLYTDLT